VGGGGWLGAGSQCLMGTVSAGEDERVGELGVVMSAQQCECMQLRSAADDKPYKPCISTQNSHACM
jgi:hypothetical protein